ncbi:unnamed protein product [Rhizophagus irregularis]|nr:unnamed protein product [Rhizophagus irregularis]
MNRGGSKLLYLGKVLLWEMIFYIVSYSLYEKSLIKLLTLRAFLIGRLTELRIIFILNWHMTDWSEEMESWGLHHATYWSRNPSSWGCLSDWDVHFIEETPGCTRDESHRNLGIELNILLNKFPSTSRQYSKANALKKALGNSDGDSANILLWEKHLEELKSIAISDRVHRHTIKSITLQEEIGRAEEQISEKSKKHKASTKECEISSSSSSSKNDENYNKQEDDDAIISDLGNDLREASESMVGKANDEPPKTPEHQIYQKQGNYSKPFASCEEQSHGFHSSEISQNLGDSIEISIGQLEEMEIEVGKIC